MKYAHKKALKSFLKNIDQRVLGGLVQRISKSRNVNPAVQTGLTEEEKEDAQKDLLYQIQRPLPTNHDLKRVEIIVLKYKAPAVEVECARRLIENTQWPYQLNFFDNRLGTKNMSKIWNQLVRESSCEYVVIMDSDVYVPKLGPCWLTRCMETFDMHPDCAVVSPMVTRTSGLQQQADIPRDNPPEKITEVFSGMCLLFKKDVFNNVGYFDEDFLLFGTDTEWSWRLLHSDKCSGYLRPDVVVNHVWHASTSQAAIDERAEYNFCVEKRYANNLYKKKTGLNDGQI